MWEEFKRSAYWLGVGVIITILLIVFVVAGLDRYKEDGTIRYRTEFDVPSNQAAAWSAGVGILGTLYGVFVGRRRQQRPAYRVELVTSKGFPDSSKNVDSSETQAEQAASETQQGEAPSGPQQQEEAPSKIEMTPHEEVYLTDYFTGLTETIYNRALQIADLQGRRDNRQTKDIAQACNEIAPGRPFPESIGHRITSSITGITVISAILAVIFGGIGFLVSVLRAPRAPQYSRSSI